MTDKFNITDYTTKKGAKAANAHVRIAQIQWVDKRIKSSLLIFASKAEFANNDDIEPLEHFEIFTDKFDANLLIGQAIDTLKTFDTRFKTLTQDDTDNTLFTLNGFTCKNGLDLKKAFCLLHSISVLPSVLSATVFVYNSKKSFDDGNAPDDIVNVHNCNYDASVLYSQTAEIFKTNHPSLYNMQADIP